MKAIILAAGLGTRLRPITDNIPKCMVSVNGIRIIDKQVDNLIRNGVTDVAVVSGYMADVLESHIKSVFPSVTVIRNVRHAETNNMYSLMLAKGFLRDFKEDFLLMNGDVYFDHEIIGAMLANGHGSLVACDQSGYLEESMKITLANGRINHIAKTITEKEYYAVSIDVYRISCKDGLVLFNEIEDIVINQKNDHSWTEVALDRIFTKTHFKPCIINGKWVEIDNHADLAHAESVFIGDKLSTM